MLGTPLAFYLDKDISDRAALVDLVKKHGGSVSQGYSAVTYILVDPHRPSGQNLYRQYANKKGKVILDARWIRECIKLAALQTFATNWAGCKVDGTEESVDPQIQETPPPRVRTRQIEQPQQQHQQQQPHTLHIDPQTHYAFEAYVPPIQVPQPQPQSWQATPAIAPEQTHITPTHILHRPAAEYRQDPTPSWNHYHQPAAPVNPAPAQQYDYSRYRDDETGWAAAADTTAYYDPGPSVGLYVQPYQSTSYMEEEDTTPEAGPSTLPPAETPEKPRGRKRVRSTASLGATECPIRSSFSYRLPLVLLLRPLSQIRTLLRGPPTPPSRVVKSTYGGNLFTADDVLYLKKYIDYCHEQGLVLSLREICERIAVKAPHHTFYSWRRYCNKHQIRLGGYTMNVDRSASPNPDGDDDDSEQPVAHPAAPSGRPPGGSIHHLMHLDSTAPRNRSPTPPRALFRSTTGKGVAFTEDDVTWLLRFMEYRRQGPFCIYAIFADDDGDADLKASLTWSLFGRMLPAKWAPHHSRASWMKFWRRHKHEHERTEADAPLPPAPEKKMRYSRGDDILLAKYFCNKIEGKSDQIFQAFARMYPHHPWKGWQEHHRIHKAKIDHFIQRLANGETLEDDDETT
ncbi:hypothetical protein MSAN_00026400 [Mycena sanguinolenta]|uniref:BRCT domain-containing protein n=1 Tax=Mycena sanguinolenta TaxID=230812 RepID=A0A8H6ZID7_9AGAR|nr:hypothetical protein MSAN_00026400 [Mycena sanguinolenta]